MRARDECRHSGKDFEGAVSPAGGFLEMNNEQ